MLSSRSLDFPPVTAISDISVISSLISERIFKTNDNSTSSDGNE